jgi:quercetin dioxygenase-like cupin family protein
MRIIRKTSQPSEKGPVEFFTGNVRVDLLLTASDPVRVSVAQVTFEPGARSAWHSHPLGQTLIGTQGVGRVQQWGEKIDEIKPGDVVWTPPGEKHWYGATPKTAMTHISVVETINGKSADWMEKVSDEQFGENK